MERIWDLGGEEAAQKGGGGTGQASLPGWGGKGWWQRKELRMANKAPNGSFWGKSPTHGCHPKGT